jgi:beta-1,4-mannosyl-glycoprotein beta-1,4-N-acetylglucosaminyltransferase
MKIYDCFIFYNELELLELRLRILDSHVDYFVLVEATKTKSGKKKSLYYEENKDKFKKWKDKLIHVIVEDMPKPGKFTLNNIYQLDSKLNLGRWRLETHQINQIKKGLKKAKDEDIILVSDLDEIPNPKKFDLMKNYVKKKIVVGFNQRFFLLLL